MSFADMDIAQQLHHMVITQQQRVRVVVLSEDWPLSEQLVQFIANLHQRVLEKRRVIVMNYSMFCDVDWLPESNSSDEDRVKAKQWQQRFDPEHGIGLFAVSKDQRGTMAFSDIVQFSDDNEAMVQTIQRFLTGDIEPLDSDEPFANCSDWNNPDSYIDYGTEDSPQTEE